MCQETLEICLDQVSHLCPGVDFSAITLKSRWDPKGRRIFVPQESEVEGELLSAEGIAPEQDPVVAAQTSQPEAGDAAGAQHRVINPVRCRGVCFDHFIGCPLDWF
ncbi:hypothetical protein PIB30_046820 [Stylosanthes scabra]|uniref:Uncharacterized protein n=1 Tax=Stylosanthes scabra TaxID=79078 RepID=A0ABU6TIR4_9FABA|nr:hypothetical protein [Stylosanthes scabra]